MAILSLTGCRSSRSTVRHGGGRGTTPSRELEKIDYAGRVTDPMGHALVSEAQQWIGTSYRYGGDSRDAGTDCSGLVMKVYGEVCGMKIPRTTRDQVKYCTKLARNRLQPGDLVFFGNGQGDDGVSHVGMYVGDGRMIHASSSRGVTVSDFMSGYWADRYYSGARVDAAAGAYAMLNKGKKRGNRQPSAPQRQPSTPSLSEPQRQQEIPTPAAPSMPTPPSNVIEMPLEEILMASGNGMPASAEYAAQSIQGIQSPQSAQSSQSSQSPQISTDSPQGAAATSAPEAAMTIDMLDMIINAKVDSIFASQFND